MSKGSRQSGAQTVTNRTELPDWLDFKLRSASDDAYGLYQGPQPRGYPDFRVTAGFNPAQLEGLAGVASTARGGTPIVNQALGQGASTLRGDYLYGGPGFDAALTAATNEIVPRQMSRFNLAGRGNSGLLQPAIAEEIADAFAGLYDKERTRQLAATGMAPQLEGLPYAADQRLLGVGDAFQQQQQRFLDEDFARFAEQQTRGQRGFDQYLARLQGLGPYAGSTQTSSRPLYSNPLAGALGGAATGLGTMNAIAGLTGGAVPGFAALAPLGALGAGIPFALGGALLGGLLS